MKYGETLRQRSIPAWAHHNIDYDDIKHFIKENTTPGKGKTVAVPGRGDDKLVEFENALFHILQDQHERIDLFVKSKAGEIQRRLEHSTKQLRALAARRVPAADHRVPISRLERYGRLENDVVKAGDEIKSLARFVATQRTAFWKLLKKYKKWTGSAELEDRFREEVLDDLKSFTKLDLGYLLDEYSAMRQSIKTLYDSQVQHSVSSKRAESQPIDAGSSTIEQLQEAVDSGSKVFFDTRLATVPLGQGGTFASYFVHPENIIELQMLLLQDARYHHSRSRQSSVATPTSSRPQTPSFPGAISTFADCHMLVADNLERFVKEQSSGTAERREHQVGSYQQRAKAAVRWTTEEDALACIWSKSGRFKSARLKKKRVLDFFDPKADFSAQREEADTAKRVEELRNELLKDNTRPLFHYSCNRSRLIGLDDDAAGLLLATLDSGITIEKEDRSRPERAGTAFPFALLSVRQEGKPKSKLVAALDNSHLVERVGGFSLEYHSVWQTSRPDNMPPPYWLPILSKDICKLPPPAMRTRPSTIGEPNAAGTASAGTGSSARTFSSTTVANTSNDLASQLESPPLTSFSKKRRRKYPQARRSMQKYWSEYDHPEDGGEDPNAYYIYIDPNDTNAFDRFLDKVADTFRRRKKSEDEALLYTSDTPPLDDDESSDDETDTATNRHRFQPTSGFGTFAQSGSAAPGSLRREHLRSFLPQFSVLCFAASLAMLVMAYILRTTGRHKYLGEVHVGVLFSMVCSLIFVFLGFMNLVRRGSTDGTRAPSLGAWGVSILVLVADVVGSGGLLTSMLG